jgi:hypothetical protein
VKRVWLLTLFLLLTPCLAAGQVPQLMSYQGVLTDNGGALVPDGNYTVTFRLYTTDMGGAAIFTETHPVVPVFRGGFSVIIGSIAALTPDFDVQYWLGIQVGGDPELTPRVKLTSSPYALMAETVVNNAITGAKILDGAIGQADIATGGVASAEILDGSIGAVDIASGAVGTSEIANSSITGIDVLDGGLTSVDMDNEPGVASVSTTTDNPLATLAENLVTRTITLPAAGFVVALGSSNIQMVHSPGTASEANLSASITSATHNTANLRNVRLSNLFSDGGTYRQALSCQEVFFFVSGGNQTIYLVASAPAGAGVSAIESSLILQYYPTQYGLVSEPNLISSGGTGSKSVTDR